MRPIDADVLLEILEDKTDKLYEFEQGVLKRTGRRNQEHTNAYRELCDWVFFESMVEEQPTVEKRKGKWVIDELDKYNVRIWKCHCSKCNKDPLNYVYSPEKLWISKKQLPSYCPNCGADMIEVK